MLEVRTISTRFMFNVFVNCYLVDTGRGRILIDSGAPRRRDTIENEIGEAGCRPVDVGLIILTHGDLDHCGNAAYFARKFGTRIAMHRDDSGMVEQGDMFWNRKPPGFLARRIIGPLMGLSESDRFRPDMYVEDGDSLSEFGLDGRILHLPGHSRGSIGILTHDGSLFCGDLLANTNKPGLWSIIDDRQAAAESVKRLEGLSINTVYPGHGRPFSMEEFKRASHAKLT